MSVETPTRVPTILLVEDDPADARLTAEALRESAHEHELVHSPSGAVALRVLADRRRDGTLPDLVVLDLNMPGMSGMEVLHRIKGDPALRSIPVTIFSTSDAPEDVRGCYEAQANAYVRKPVALDEFFDVVVGMERFWVETAESPNGQTR